MVAHAALTTTAVVGVPSVYPARAGGSEAGAIGATTEAITR